SHSSPGVPEGADTDASSSRRSLRRPVRSFTPPATTATASSPASSIVAARFATPPSPTPSGSFAPPRGPRPRPDPATHLGKRLCAPPRSLDSSVLGPAALFRLRGRERQVLVVKAPERREAVQVVGEAVQRAAAGGSHAGVSFSVDVDPQ